MKTKRFIRFVCNTAAHQSGEKIKALNGITKVYDDKGVFIEIRKPYIKALENQIEVDIEGMDYKQYLPLHHFKQNGSKIVKKSKAEITSIENTIAQVRAKKVADNVVIEKERSDNEKIVDDAEKTDSEKLNALIKVRSLQK